MNRVVTRMGFATLALVAGVTAHAQSTSTTGSMSGVVTDANGAPLAGATITASSAQVTRSAVTGADGSFRFGLLNIGEWTLKVSRSGAVGFSQKVTIAANQNQTVNVKMAKEAEKVVEVVAASNTIDTTTAQKGNTLSAESISSVPLGRDMNTVAFLVPGVTTSGFGMGPSIGGASAAENTYVLDGLTTTDYRYGGIGNTLITDFIEQVEVQTGGFKPEFSALGGVFNAVTKSGSNEFKGSAWLTYDAKDMQAKPKAPVQNGGIPFRQADPTDRYDVGFEVGGAFIKDKLFYFVGVSSTVNENKNVSANSSGFVGTPLKTVNNQFVTKLNFFATQDLQFTLFANHNPFKTDQDKSYGAYGDGNFGVHDKGFSSGINVTMDWTISPSLFLSAKIGQTKNEFENIPVNKTESAISDAFWFWNGGTNADAVADLPGGVGAFNNSGPQAVATPGGARPGNYNRGGFGLYQSDFGKTDQMKADLSWFLGAHTLKTGVSFTSASYRIDEGMTGDGGTHSLRRTNVGLGTKFYDVRTYIGNKAEVKTEFTAFYLQDTWTIMPGLNFAFGARFEGQNLKDSAGRSFLKFDLTDGASPRLGIIWDVNNNGRTKVAANFGRYFQNIPQRVSIRQRANEFFDRYYSVLTNYNGGVGLPTWGVDDAVFDFSTPFSYIPIEDSIKLPRRDEIVLGIDHTLDSGWTVGAHYQYRKLTNPIEDISPGAWDDVNGFFVYADRGTQDFGQAILANPKPGVMTWTTTATSESRLSDGFDKLSWNSTYPEAYNTYRSIDFTFEKKTSSYYVSGSYSLTRLYGNYEGVVSASNGQPDGNITASWDYPAYWGEGPLSVDRTQQAKIFGSRTWDMSEGRLTLGLNASMLSGTPISRYDNGASSNPVINDEGGYGNAVPQNHKFGQYGRNPTVYNADFRAEFAISFGKKVSVTPSLDIFNLFNSREATGQVQQATDGTGAPSVTYGLVNGWQTGRRFRFGVKVRF